MYLSYIQTLVFINIDIFLLSLSYVYVSSLNNTFDIHFVNIGKQTLKILN